tara:strand:+ start:290 stop:1057 length:768 start_codon:yes stop_codon:yes gene_type:complete
MAEEEINIFSACGIYGLFEHITSYLNAKSILNIMESSFVKQLDQGDGEKTYQKCIEKITKTTQLFELHRRYRRESKDVSPFVYACEKGRMDDVQLFVNLHPFHKYYIRMKGVNDHDMTLKEYVNQLGKDSYGYECTPLIAAAFGEHFQVVQYLIEHSEADPNIATSVGFNALHWAAWTNRTNTKLTELLLTNMSLGSINKKEAVYGSTPLDLAYRFNKSPIKQKIIDLIRSKGGKANHYNENGRRVGAGNGDLNH